MGTSILSIFKTIALSIALIGIAVVSQSVAKADPLLPGSTIVGPSTGLVPAGGTLLASISVPFSNATLGGTARAAVVRTDGGLLTFYYQFSSTGGTISSDDVNRIAMFNFAGFTTDVTQVTNGSVLGAGFVDGTVASVTADRNLNGSTVGFNFAGGTFNVGTTSLTFCIATNATLFISGNFSIQDGVNQNVPAFAPTSVPEPASMLLLGTGLVGVAGVARRRFRGRS